MKDFLQIFLKEKKFDSGILFHGYFQDYGHSGRVFDAYEMFQQCCMIVTTQRVFIVKQGLEPSSLESSSGTQLFSTGSINNAYF